MKEDFNGKLFNSRLVSIFLLWITLSKVLSPILYFGFTYKKYVYRQENVWIRAEVVLEFTVFVLIAVTQLLKMINPAQTIVPCCSFVPKLND